MRRPEDAYVWQTGGCAGSLGLRGKRGAARQAGGGGGRRPLARTSDCTWRSAQRSLTRRSADVCCEARHSRKLPIAAAQSVVRSAVAGAALAAAPMASSVAPGAARRGATLRTAPSSGRPGCLATATSPIECSEGTSSRRGSCRGPSGWFRPSGCTGWEEEGVRGRASSKVGSGCGSIGPEGRGAGRFDRAPRLRTRRRPKARPPRAAPPPRARLAGHALRRRRRRPSRRPRRRRFHASVQTSRRTRLPAGARRQARRRA